MAIGNPISLTDNVASKVIRVLATNNQTVFTVNGGYNINQIAVFRNGVRLSNNSDFVALDGVTVTLVNAAVLNDEVLFQIQDDFKVADAIVSAASSQTINGDLSITGNLYYQGSSTGILTTGGDGSTLTGIVTTLVAGDNIAISGSTGTVTITGLASTAGLANTSHVVTESLVVSGISTLESTTATSLNVTGVITATSFEGDGAGLTGVGLGTTGSINTSGIITASTISADEFIGTGDKLIFRPAATAFSPTDGSTDQTPNTNIIITFDQQVYAGVGSIFLRNSSGIGTEIASIGIGSTAISISNQTLTINTVVALGDTVSALPYDTDVYVVLPSASIVNALGSNIATISNYNFTIEPFTTTSISPGSGTTDVSVDTNITLTFPEPPVRGTGTVQLRSDSASGALIESFDAASSGQISVSGNNWILNPTSDLPILKSIFPIIPSTAIKEGSGAGPVTGYVGLNTTGSGAYSFETSVFEYSSVSPANGATLATPSTNIEIIFTSPPTRGTGTVELRYNTVGGTLIEAFDAAASSRISIVGNNWVLNPTDDLYDDPVFLIVPNTAIDGFLGLNVAGGQLATYSFQAPTPPLGSAYEGGYLLCQSGGTRWIVAPSSTQVTTSWDNRSSAASSAGSGTGCGGWFVPSCAQLQNPGANCATYWDTYNSGKYWSNSQEGNGWRGVNVYIPGGGYGLNTKGDSMNIRAFRTVTY